MTRSKTKQEPFEVMLRKFNRDIQQSGILTQAKKKKYHEKAPSRTIRRKSAIIKNQRRKALRGF